MTARYIRTTTSDGICLLQLDRPQARNALDRQVLSQLAEAIAAGESNREIAAFVITGGPAVFSAGADIDAFGGLTAATYPVSANRRAFDAIRNTGKPVIAAVAGYCLGGGCEIAFGCDLVIAGDNAIFGQPEIGLGIIPGAGGTQLWAERSGTGLQARAALLGDFISAFEARRYGLVEAVVPASRIVSAGMALARGITRKAPLATIAAKTALRARQRGTVASALETELLLMSSLLASEDAREGTRAFLEKRPANFTGA